jgi:hypothetical protein
MSESSESSVEDNIITLTNAEYNKLHKSYFELNPNATKLDVGIEEDVFGFAKYIKMQDDFVHLFTITDRKKFDYARIKYEF